MDTVKYDIFLSYHYETDREIAAALESGLRNMARPWYRLQALKVYRDRSQMGANPDLKSQIQTAIEQSQYFLLLLSPSACESPWVRDEVAYWLSLKRNSDHLIVALTSGDPVWNHPRSAENLGAVSNLVTLLTTIFPIEPKWVDFRSWPTWSHRDLKNKDFSEKVAEIAAPAHGLTPDDLQGLQKKRRRNSLILAALMGVVLIGMVAALFSSRKTAKEQELARQKAVELQSILAQARDDKSEISASELAHAADLIRESYRLKKSSTTLALAEELAPLLPMREFNHGVPIVTTAISPSGNLLAAGGSDGSVSVWNWSDGSEVIRFHHGNRIRQLVWSVDGKTLAARDDACAVRIWRNNTQKHDEISGPPERPTRSQTESALSRLQQEINKAIQDGYDPPIELMMSPDRTLGVWDFVNCTTSSPYSVQNMSWSPSATIPLLALMDRGGTLRFWNETNGQFSLEKDIRDGKENSAWSLDSSWIKSQAWSPDGSHFALGTQDGSVFVFSSQTGDQVAHISHNGPVRLLSWSTGGEWLASAAAFKEVKLWNRATLSTRSVTSGESSDITSIHPAAISWNPKKPILAVRGTAGEVLVLDAPSGRMIFMPNDAGKIIPGIFSTQWAPDGRFLATAARAPGKVDDSSIDTETTDVSVWNAVVGRVIWGSPFDERVSVLAWGSESENLLLAIGTASGSLQVVDPEKGLNVLKTHYNGKVEKLLWNSNNQVLGIVVQALSRFARELEQPYQRFFRWDRQAQKSWVIAHDGAGSDIFFHPQEQILVTGGADGMIRVWGQGKLLELLPGIEGFY